LGFSVKKAVGTSVFIMFITAFSGVIGYFENSNLNIQLGIILGISAAVGGAFSSFFANKIKEEILARFIGGFFIFFALVMFVLKVLFPFLHISF
jgi:uncharacterized membrane protein YfcA